MPVGTGLTFLDMQTELVDLRFGAGRRENIKKWINSRYRLVFGMRDWPFRHVYRESVTIDGTGAVSATVSPLRRAFALELASDGSALNFVQPSVMREEFLANNTNSGVPVDYMQIDNVLQVRPVPSGSVAASLSYQRAVCCFKQDGTIRAGGMVADDDYPLWPQEHHYLLVTGGMAVGLKNVNDPTWEALDQEYGMALDLMLDDLFPADTYGNLQYGRQPSW